MATARAAPTVAVLDGKLYAVGGYNGGILSSVERYDPTANMWEEVAPMAAARQAHGVAVLDGKLYAVGGYGAGALSSVERYGPATNAWEAVAPIATVYHSLYATVAYPRLGAISLWWCSTASCTLRSA